MLFFKKKEKEKDSLKQPPQKGEKAPRSLQEVAFTRILTAEGWKRKALKQKKPGSRKLP